MTTDPPVYQCPVDAPIRVLGGKWKLVLLFYILQEPRRNDERVNLEALLQPLCDWGLYWSDKTGARILALET